jgi:hypothetical protein
VPWNARARSKCWTSSPVLTTVSLKKVTANKIFWYHFSNGYLPTSSSEPLGLYSHFSKIGSNLFQLLKT